MQKVIGLVTTYQGSEHRYLRDHEVRIVAVLKGAAKPDHDPDAENTYVTDDETLARLGGLTADDRCDVQPWIAAESRFSFATSDALVTDLTFFTAR